MRIYVRFRYKKGGFTMEFITPKSKNSSQVKWRISDETIGIVKAYSEYCDYGESEVVDKFLKNLRDDENFIEWVSKKRNNKRLLKLIGCETDE